MTAEERELMNVLCERIRTEEDHETFTALVRELDNLLSNKDQRLTQVDEPGRPS